GSKWIGWGGGLGIGHGRNPYRCDSIAVGDVCNILLANKACLVGGYVCGEILQNIRTMETCACQAALTIAQQVQLFCGGMAFAVPLIVTSIIVRAAKAGGMVND